MSCVSIHQSVCSPRNQTLFTVLDPINELSEKADFQTTKKLTLAETMTNRLGDWSELTTDRQRTNKEEMSAQSF